MLSDNEGSGGHRCIDGTVDFIAFTLSGTFDFIEPTPTEGQNKLFLRIISLTLRTAISQSLDPP
jgi:hypothetical protein